MIILTALGASATLPPEITDYVVPSYHELLPALNDVSLNLIIYQHLFIL